MGLLGILFNAIASIPLPLLIGTVALLVAIISYVYVYLVRGDGFRTRLGRVASFLILLTGITLLLISIPGIGNLPGTLLNAVASVLAAVYRTLLLLLPFIGMVTSLIAIAALVILILVEEGFYSWTARICWSAGLLVAVIVLLVSIPGFLDAALTVVGGAVSALLALLSIALAQIVQAYTARRTARWTVQTERYKQERTEELERYKQEKTEELERYKQVRTEELERYKQQETTRIESQNQLEAAFQEYLDTLSELLGAIQSPDAQNTNHKVAVAKAKTIVSGRLWVE